MFRLQREDTFIISLTPFSFGALHKSSYTLLIYVYMSYVKFIDSYSLYIYYVHRTIIDHPHIPPHHSNRYIVRHRYNCNNLVERKKKRCREFAEHNIRISALGSLFVDPDDGLCVWDFVMMITWDGCGRAAGCRFRVGQSHV